MEEMLYFGYDESNHGRYPEICVLTASTNPNDIRFQKPLLGKNRSNHKTLESKIANIEHRFLLFNEEDKNRLTDPTSQTFYKHRKLGIIITSLLDEFELRNKINIYIDGLWRDSAIEYTKKLIHKTQKKAPNHINLIPQAKGDRRRLLVNYADQIAHRNLKASVEKVQEDQRKTTLKIDEYMALGNMEKRIH
ncbi:MAG: hypothetical protein ACI83O_000809 [Patescibacteria group bacterium]|jgi:hypothetical protein